MDRKTLFKKIKKMVILFFAITSFFLPAYTYAGSWNGWIYQNPYPTANTLLAVKFITPQKGWAVGVFGTILYTEDGGVNWELQKSGTNQDLRAVTFVNEKVGWIAGNGGIILHTEDGGNIWKPQGDVIMPLFKIFFINEKEGWVGGEGGTLLYTKDSGKDWEEQNVGTIKAIAGIYFINPSAGWVLAGGSVYKTIDGGKEWYETKLPPVKVPMTGYDRKGPGPRPMILEEQTEHGWIGSIYFINEKKGWVALDLWYVFYTEDGGKTWETIELPNLASKVVFTDDKNGCVGGTSIICTEDGGKTWKERLGIKPRDRESIEGFLISTQDMSFASKTDGWAVGGTGHINIDLMSSYVMKTDDGGRSWKMLSRIYDQPYFIDSKTGWKVDNDHLPKPEKGRIYRTDDGGDAWTVQKEIDTNIDINKFFFIDSAKGWAVGTKVVTQKGGGGSKFLNYFIFHTTDGGKTWITRFDEPVGKNDTIFDGLFDIHFINNKDGWVVGSKGRILHTKDNGEHWEQQKSGTDLTLSQVFFSSAKKGVAIGDRGLSITIDDDGETVAKARGVILYTEDGGQHWRKAWEKRQVLVKSVFFADKDTGWASVETLDGSLLLHSEDGGKTWSEDKINPAGRIYFLDKNHGAILTDVGNISATMDGGKTWEWQPKSIHRYPRHISEIFKQKDK